MLLSSSFIPFPPPAHAALWPQKKSYFQFQIVVFGKFLFRNFWQGFSNMRWKWKGRDTPAAAVAVETRGWWLSFAYISKMAVISFLRHMHSISFISRWTKEATIQIHCHIIYQAQGGHKVIPASRRSRLNMTPHVTNLQKTRLKFQQLTWANLLLSTWRSLVEPEPQTSPSFEKKRNFDLK